MGRVEIDGIVVGMDGVDGGGVGKDWRHRMGLERDRKGCMEVEGQGGRVQYGWE